MSAAMKQVIEKLEELPAETREAVSREMLVYLTRLERLRADVQEGIDAIERGEAVPLDIGSIIAEVRRGTLG